MDKAKTPLSEDALIELVRRELGAPGGRVLVGIGDDAAVISPPPEGSSLLFTTDTMTQGTHFKFDWSSPYQVGWKAAAAAVSDIGAMGGRPIAAVVSVALTGSEKKTTIIGLTQGLKAVAERYKFTIAGGDTVRSNSGITITVSVIGEAPRGLVALRKGAKPGDALMLIGDAGAAAAGLEALRRKGKAGLNSAERKVADRHLAPEPLIDAGIVAASTGMVTAMMDLSDGLSADLPRLCARSCTGATVRASDIPIHPDTIKACRSLGIDPVETAISGGEDYSLLLTAKRENSRALADAVYAATGCPVSFIGEITPAENGIVLISTNGKLLPWPDTGFKHF